MKVVRQITNLLKYEVEPKLLTDGKEQSTADNSSQKFKNNKINCNFTSSLQWAKIVFFLKSLLIYHHPQPGVKVPIAG